MLNKVIVFVFFAHKKYSHSFITLRLNHWCHMDYFNDILTTFLGLERGNCVAVYAGSESSRISSKNLNFCSENERNERRCLTGLGWVTNPLMLWLTTNIYQSVRNIVWAFLIKAHGNGMHHIQFTLFCILLLTLQCLQENRSVFNKNYICLCTYGHTAEHFYKVQSRIKTL